MKKKNEKLKINKKISTFIITILVIIGLFTSIYFIDLINFNKNHKDFDEKYMIKMMYLIADKKNTTSKETIEEVVNSEENKVLFSINEVVPLVKKGDFLYAYLEKFTNKKLLEDVIDTSFAKNNDYGETIDGLEYDKKTKTLKIPFSYYKNIGKYEVPIEAQLLSLLTVEDLMGMDVDYSFKKLVTTNKKITIDNLAMETRILIGNKNINLNDLDIYVNNSSTPIDNSYVGYNKKTSVLTLYMPAVLINKLDIKLNRPVLPSVSALNEVTVSSMRAIKISEEPNLGNNGIVYVDAYFYKPGGDRDPDKVNTVTCHDYSNSNHDNMGVYCKGGTSDIPAMNIDRRNDSTNNPFSLGKYTLYYSYTSKNHSGTKDKLDDLGSGNNITTATANTKMYKINYSVSNTYAARFSIFGKNSVYDNMDDFNDRTNSIGHILDFEENTFYKAKVTSNGTVDHSSIAGDYITVSGDNMNNYWFSLHCVSSETAAGMDDDLVFRIQRIYQDSNSAVVKIMITKNGSSLSYLKNYNFSSTQGAIGYLKFEWEGSTAINMKKETLDPNDTNEYKFGVYTNSACTKHATSNGNSVYKYVRPNETATYGIKENGEYYLPAGKTYYIKEEVDSNGFAIIRQNGSDISSEYKPVSNCLPVTTVEPPEPNSGITQGPTITNYKAKFCYAASKQDAEASNINGSVMTSDSPVAFNKLNDGGYIIFGPVFGKGSSHEITETSAPTGYCKGVNDNNEQTYTVNANTEAIATYNSTTGTMDYACPSDYSAYSNASKIFKNSKKYYCARVMKVDSRGNQYRLANAKFTSEGLTGYNSAGVANGYTKDDGYYYFFTGSQVDEPPVITVKETEAPAGYVILTKTQTVTSKQMPCGTKNSDTIAQKIAACNSVYTDETNSIFKNSRILINWYKTTEDERTTAEGAKFKASFTNSNNQTQYIKVKAEKEDQIDEANVTKKCYVFDSFTTSMDSASVLESGDVSPNHDGSMRGEACITGLPELGTYTVEEIKPVKYHTFGTKKKITLTTNTIYQPMTKTTNQFINYPTEFKFTKKVTNTDGTQEGTFAAKTTEELKKLVFNVYDSEGNPVSFILKNGVYEYAGNNVDPASGEASTTLNLNNSRQINIKHLPTGTYTIKEVDTSSCGLNNGKQNTITQSTTRPGSAGSCSNPGSGNNGDCIGYYMPDYTSTTNNRFTITDCSSSNATSCSSYGVVETNTDNTPTEITLTKKDFYSYNDASDIQDEDRGKDSKESEAAFENAKERSDFDRIDFKIKDSNGNYLNFYYVGGTSTTCSSDSDYSIYRYVPGLTLGEGTDPNVFTGVIGSVTQTLHACGGHIKIIGLCRGKTYTFEEVKVPDDSVYVRENTDGTPTSVCFEIPCVGDEVTTQTSKTVIVDKPTRQRLEKRDSKYNYLIPDESVTFEVYRCPKDNPDCHPSDYGTIDEETKEFKINKETAKAAGIELVKFSPRSILNGDEEDPNFDDTSSNQDKDNVNKANEDALNGVEVYRYMSDSDAKNKAECRNDLGGSNCYVTRLHPDKGILVFRYLQSGYTYKIVEIAAPKNYLLPTGYDKENTFKVISTTVNTEKLNIANQPTAILVRKFDGNGNLLPGAKFRIYQVTNYDPSRKPQDQEKRVVSLKTIRDGVYEARPKEDTEVIVTCDNRNGNCADTTKLTFDLYNDTWANFDNLETNNGTNAKVALQEGTALIQYLEYNYHYVIEEIEAPKGYSLPEDEDDRFTEIYIDKNETRIQETDSDALVNYPTPFTFYKFDEYNTPLDGGKFILQKLNSDKKYETMRLTKVEGEVDKNGNPIALYKASIDGEIEEIDTTNGKATVYYLEAGQYRILEVKAPEGYELPKKTINVCTFFVDEDGVVRGNSIITNKPETKTKEVKNEAFAELIITPATGQKVIKYGAIIAGLILIIAGLMIFMKKRK